jgi:hypothetical protein
MKGFVVRALTEIGTVALDQCIQEEKVELCKRSLLDRMKFHKIWIRKTTRDPLTDSWFINPDAERFVFIDKNFSIARIVSDVDIAMIKNGCKKDIDYIVEVQNE